jgi:cysteine sulfinate desulfinase/cysteine desulfurase-like protein
MCKKKIIYLGNNAFTQINKNLLDTMMYLLTNDFANANSIHQFGVNGT